MGYSVFGTGTLCLKDEKQSEQVKKIIEKADTAIVVTEEWKDELTMECLEGVNFWEDEVTWMLNQIVPYLASGEITFEGQDSEHWKFKLEEGSWQTYAGSVVFDDELAELRKAFRNALNRCLLMDKKELSKWESMDDYLKDTLGALAASLQINGFDFLEGIKFPPKGETIPEYRIRCLHCACLAEKDGKWFCDEAGELCEDVADCPEGITVQKARFVSKFVSEKTAEHIGEIVRVIKVTENSKETMYRVLFPDGTVCGNVYPGELDFNYME